MCDELSLRFFWAVAWLSPTPRSLHETSINRPTTSMLNHRPGFTNPLEVWRRSRKTRLKESSAISKQVSASNRGSHRLAAFACHALLAILARRKSGMPCDSTVLWTRTSEAERQSAKSDQILRAICRIDRICNNMTFESSSCRCNSWKTKCVYNDFPEPQWVSQTPSLK